MKVNSSYSIQIKGNKRALQSTVLIYCEAVSYLMKICNIEYVNLKKIDYSNAQMMFVEKLIHSTSTNTAKYKSFDNQFYKMPSYLRRSAINEALGNVKSYQSNLELSKSNRTKAPKFNTNRHSFPCLFKEGMFKFTSFNECKIKCYVKKDWVWYPFQLKDSDVKYITKYFHLKDASAPSIEKSHHSYHLRFSFSTKVELTDIKDIICSVDLGINTDAVCSIMSNKGTVVARKFIQRSTEKDRMFTCLNEIKKAQQHGNSKMHRLWRWVNNYNEAIAVQTAHEIVEFAKSMNAGVIVLEYLNIQGKKKGSKKQCLALWRKREINKRIEQLAHRYGLRISHVTAVNTSKLAFDGSGEVQRSKNNFSLCTFTTNKQYNTDLNASYNIGARYFIREIQKSMSESKWLSLQAKVPEVAIRTKSTLSTLISLTAVL